MKSRVLTKRLVAIIMTAALIVTGPGFSLSALGRADQSAGSAVSQQEKELDSKSSLNDGSKTENRDSESLDGKNDTAKKVRPKASKDDAGSGSEKESSSDLKNGNGKSSDKDPSGKDASKEASEKDEPELVNKNIEANDSKYEITVKGDLPKDAELDVKEIIDSKDRDSKEHIDFKDYQKAAVKEVGDKDKEFDGDSLPYTRFFDITIKYDNGKKEFQPDDSVQLKIDTKDDSLKDKDLTFKALHFKNNDNYREGESDDVLKYDADIMSSKIENKDTLANNYKKEKDKEKELTLKTDSFSVYGVVYYYTVDFYYTPDNDNNDGKLAEHHMNGGSEMTLSELFKKLKIDKDITDIKKVVFTDEELLKIVKKDNDYIIKSMKPFTSHEELEVTFDNGESIVIIVEDEIAHGTFGSDLQWSIDDDGKLIVEPVEGKDFGTITTLYCCAASKGGTTPQVSGKQLWPWEAHKDDIKTAELKGKIRTYGGDNNFQLIGMFRWCDNLESVDVGGLNVSRVGNVSHFFADCPKLKEIKGLDKWPESVHQNTGEKLGTTSLQQVASMFRNCPALEEIDLRSWTSNGKMKNFQNMFNGCKSLKSFTLNNRDFVTADGSQWETAQHNGNGVFCGCDSLETVDMSNITIKANASGMRGLEELFAGLPALKTVNMKDIDVSECNDLSDMFNGCEGLETLVFSPKAQLTATVKDMDGFVGNCSKLKTLNISNLDNSKVEKHELGFTDLDALETLIADNSNVFIRKNPVSGSANFTNMDDISFARDVDFMHDAEFTYTPNPKHSSFSEDKLENLDSNDVVLMAIEDNNGGHPSQAQIRYTSTNGRGMLAPGTYVRTSDPDAGDMAVPETFYVIDGMNQNKPIIEFKVGGDWQKWDNTKEHTNNVDPNFGSNKTGYYIKSEPSSGSFNTKIYTNSYSLEQWRAGTDANDRYKYDEGVPIRITYPQSATSINGVKHDVVITVKSITFENMSRVPNAVDETYTNFDEDFNEESISNPWGPASERSDKAKVIGGPGRTTANRYVLNADIGELRFWNQLKADDHYQDLYSKGSGTYIDFNISIARNNDEEVTAGQSVLYWCDDLDLPENESWTMHPSDPTQDVFNGRKYGPGGEGIMLGDGNHLDTLVLANRTYLKVGDIDDGTGNYLYGSKEDPATKKTRFYVKSDATSADYKWTSGVSCTTLVLRSTSFDRSDILDINLNATAEKTINKKAPEDSDNRSFEFVLEPSQEVESVKVGDDEYKNKADTIVPFDEEGNQEIKVRNNGGKVDFGKMTFIAPGGNFVDTGTVDPFVDHKVYMDSDNIKFYYDGEKDDGSGRQAWTWHEKDNVITDPDTGEETHEITYDGPYKYEPVLETTKAYVFKITERKVKSNKDVIGFDDSQYFVKIILTAPQTDEDLDKGSKAEITIGKMNTNTGEIDWDDANTVTKYGKDTKDVPFEIKAGTFNNKKVYPIDVQIPVKKILKGRPWKNDDAFAAALILTGDNNTPMPSGSKTVDDKPDGKPYAEIVIDDKDTPVKDGDKIVGYQDSFGAITFKYSDIKEAGKDGKTFHYNVRELEPSETEVPSVPGVTYDSQPAKVEVTVKLDDSDSEDPKLTYTIKYTDEEGKTIQIPNFTNTYDARQTIYKMEAVKDYWDTTGNTSKEIQLNGGEFDFVLKPIGQYADIAPMPKDTSGEGANRTYRKANEDDGDIQFEVESNPDDGLVFNYQSLLASGVSYAALHSDEGVDFEYEMYEVIPDNAVNNNDGTWVYEDKENGIIKTYDGIHHTRMITVKVRSNTDDSDHPFDELYIVGHKDTHEDDYYLDKDGKKQSVRNIPNYDPEKYHFKQYEEGEEGDIGAPIFINYYKELPGQVTGDETYGLKNQDQQGVPKYDVVPGNPVDITTAKLEKPDKEGATISDDEKTVTIPGEGTYILNSTGTVTFRPVKDFVGDPTPINIKCKDTRGNDLTAQYTPHVIDPVDKQDATRTIHFTYETKDGKQITSDVKQTVTLARHAEEVDPKTGDVKTWGNWSSETFPAVNNPDKEAGKGWYTTDIAGELTVSSPGAVQDVYVVYQKEHYTVTYVDGKHGKSNGGKLDKEYGDKPQKNTVTAAKGYKFTGEYSYVITDNDGNVIKKGKTKDPYSIKVIGNIVFTPIYVKTAVVDPEKKKHHKKKVKKQVKQKVRKMSGTKTSKTGDDSNMLPFVMMMIGSVILIGLLAAARRRRQ